MIEKDEEVFNAIATLIGGDGSKKLKPSRLVARLAKATGLVQTDIQQSLGRLGRAGKLVGVNARGEPEQLVGWSDPSLQPVPKHVCFLKQVISAKSGEISDSDANVILRAASQFEGFKYNEIEQIVSSIIVYARLSGGERSSYPDKYIHSAKNLLSSSKALDSLSKILVGFGCQLPRDSPVYYALTAGNPLGSRVIFIENPRVFNFLVPHVDQYDAMIVSSYGYGLTLANIGDLLAANSIVTTSVDHYPNSTLSSSLSDKSCLYWGDLDYEGIQIYESLKRSFPEMVLSGAYELMVNLLQEGNGHPYHKLFGKGGQAPSKCKSREGQLLMDLCRIPERGVDQEAVCDVRFLDAIFSELHI